jgi:hypothetical protein
LKGIIKLSSSHIFAYITKNKPFYSSLIPLSIPRVAPPDDRGETLNSGAATTSPNLPPLLVAPGVGRRQGCAAPVMGVVGSCSHAPTRGCREEGSRVGDGLRSGTRCWPSSRLSPLRPGLTGSWEWWLVVGMRHELCGIQGCRTTTLGVGWGGAGAMICNLRPCGRRRGGGRRPGAEVTRRSSCIRSGHVFFLLAVLLPSPWPRTSSGGLVSLVGSGI